LARRAVALAPDDPDCQMTLGAALYRTGDWKEACAVLTKAQERLGERDGRVHFLLALACGHLEDREAAVRWHERGLQAMQAIKGPGNALLGQLQQLRRESDAVLGKAPDKVLP